MGICFSKKGSSFSSASPHWEVSQAPVCTKQGIGRTPASPAPKKVPVLQPKIEASVPKEETFVQKEAFVIKHRKSHDRDTSGKVAVASPSDSTEKSVDGSTKEAPEATGNVAGAPGGGLAVATGIRTSSCTKEEVESILIQCGRLSHSGSASGKAVASPSRPGSGGRSRRYSGSKRSYDFDHSHENEERGRPGNPGECGEDEAAGERRPRRQLSGSQGSRRRTPSRERDQQRSGSTERRRVSRSPGRRSEITSASAPGASDKPGKLVSVPATVPSSAEAPTQQTKSVKRISVKRNVGEGGRTAASPRSQSPARAKEGLQTLSRNSSRKAEHSPYRRNPSADNDLSRKHEQSPYRRNPSVDVDPSRKNEQSPYRRNPLTEIDQNLAPPSNKVSVLKPNVDPNSRRAFQVALSKANNSNETEKLNIGSRAQEQQPKAAEAENKMPQKLTRSRSARRSSGHIDFNPEVPSNPTSYTNLLLEDIQNFHQTNPPASVSLPACVSKAHSIFQAVADLNNTTASDISNMLSEDTRIQPQPSFQFSTNCHKDPFVESEVGVGDDLTEPSMHKYVTMKRGTGSTTPREDREDLESSGSNSIVCGSGTVLWEPGSASSSDCWTSSSANRAGFSSKQYPEPELDDAMRKTSVHEHSGIRRNRVQCQ